MPNPSTIELQVQTLDGEAARGRTDTVAVEEPLEIRLGFERGRKRVQQTISITMRTPGNDPELAAGFLFTEGIVQSPEQIARIPDSDGGLANNTVLVDLAAGVEVDLDRLERHFYTTSSCGVCGKTSIAAINTGIEWPPLKGRPIVEAAMIYGLPDVLRAAQAGFAATGGVHAAALFDDAGHLLGLREDVGRHNALDKLIGAEWLAGRVPLQDKILLLSGRASFELMQKAIAAGLPIVAAVGAPSSLAVELARDFDVTLLGFVRNNRFNIYSSPWRIREAVDEKRVAC